MSLIDNQQYFKDTKFIASFFGLKDLPRKSSNLREVVFVGRSNCGKSSIINSVTKKHKLAAVSKIPGRTQAINYFEVNADKYLVDLPGYGYAKVPTKTKLNWGNLLQNYLISRSNQIHIILIMDIRHPFKELDLKMLDFCCSYKISTHIVLNKCDQLTKTQIKNITDLTTKNLKNYPWISNQITSTTKNIGIEDLREKIISWLK